MSNIDTEYLLKYLLRAESAEERTGLPIPRPHEKNPPYELLPNTPLMKDEALKYGELMFALGRRQVSMEVRGWLRDNGLKDTL